MTPNVRTCLPDDNLAVALERMSEEKVRRLPIVDAKAVSRACSRSTTSFCGDLDVAASKGRSWSKRCDRFVLRTTGCSRPRTSTSAQRTLISRTDSCSSLLAHASSRSTSSSKARFCLATNWRYSSGLIQARTPSLLARCRFLVVTEPLGVRTEEDVRPQHLVEVVRPPVVRVDPWV